MWLVTSSSSTQRANTTSNVRVDVIAPTPPPRMYFSPFPTIWFTWGFDFERT